MSESGTHAQRAEQYYDSEDADAFYNRVYGGEFICIGTYHPDGAQTVEEGEAESVRRMARILEPSEGSRGLDIGAGYGGATRSLVHQYGCEMHCVNISRRENEYNRRKNQELGLAEKITVQHGDFEDLPCEDEGFDFVWSQDAMLHSDNKDQVFAEVHRVLKPGGEFIFTDPMQDDGADPATLQPVLERVQLDNMGSVEAYREMAEEVGLEELRVLEMPEQLVHHYGRVLRELIRKEQQLLRRISQEYLNRQKRGLQHWVEFAKHGKLNWGILHFRKAA